MTAPKSAGERGGGGGESVRTCVYIGECVSGEGVYVVSVGVFWLLCGLPRQDSSLDSLPASRIDHWIERIDSLLDATYACGSCNTTTVHKATHAPTYVWMRTHAM
jgi:hypothetical protein